MDQIVDATENFASCKETTLISSYERERAGVTSFFIHFRVRNVAMLTPFFNVSSTAQLILKNLEKVNVRLIEEFLFFADKCLI